MLQRCNVVNLRTLANCCTRVGLCINQSNNFWQKYFFRVVFHSMITVNIPPTWQRGFVFSSVTSIHLKCSQSTNFIVAYKRSKDYSKGQLEC